MPNFIYSAQDRSKLEATSKSLQAFKVRELKIGLYCCRADDFGGMPRAALPADWHPRSLYGVRKRRPALAKGPAVPAAGWRLHRGEPEPGDEDKIPPAAVSPKVVWTQQDRQRQRTGVTHATTGLHQLVSKSLPHERIRGKREGICLPDAGPRGKRRFIKCNRQKRTEEGQKITPKTQLRRADSRTAGHLTCN
jgi:hypothetical protein